jgi:chromosomal replication initiator protein
MKLDKRKRELIFETIAYTVQTRYNISYLELASKSKERSHVLPKQLVMYLAYVVYDKLQPYEYIGSYYNRDHATALHACKTIGNQIENDKGLKNEIEELKRLIDIKINR